MSKTTEQLQAEWDRIQYIKRIVYGLGIVSREEAPDYWKDRDRIQKEVELSSQ